MSETKKTGRKGYLRQLASRVEQGSGEFMKTWKTQAKRSDLVGDVTYRGLKLVHGGLGLAARSLSRMEKATQPPHRPAKPEALVPEAPHKRPAHPVAVHHGKQHEPEPTRS